jgi:hypothetical protein
VSGNIVNSKYPQGVTIDSKGVSAYILLLLAPALDHDRFRDWLSKKLKRNRGLASKLAEHIDAHRNWPGRYVKGKHKIYLEDAAKVAAFLNTSLSEVCKYQPEGYESLTVPVSLADSLHDPAVVGCLEAFLKIDSQDARYRAANLVRVAAGLPLLQPANESPREKTRTGSTTARRGPRR